MLTLSGATNFTSRVLNTTTYASEALLFVNEPAPITLPDAQGTYLMADSSVAYNKLRFPNITVTEPGPSGASVYRFTNLRASIPKVNLTQLIVDIQFAFSNVSLPTPLGYPSNGISTVAIGMNVLDNPSGGKPTPQLLTANALSPLAAPVQLSRCLPNNLSLADAPATANYLDGRTFTLRVEEAAPNVLRKRGESTYVNPNTFPAITQYAMIGIPYQTESMNWRTAIGWPQSPAAVPAGQANAGTRVFVKFTSVPSGLRIFGGANDQGSPSNPAIKRVRAVNMHGSLGTAGPTVAASLANATIEGGLVESQAFGGARWLLYEVLPSIDYTSFETLDLPITVAHKGGSAVGVGTMKIQAGLGPLSAATLPDSTTIIPRFVDISTARDAVTIAPCVCAYPTVSQISRGWINANTFEFRFSVKNNSAAAMNNVQFTDVRGRPASANITSATPSPLNVGTLAPAQTVTAVIRLNVPDPTIAKARSLAYALSLNSGACTTLVQWTF